MSLLYDRRLSDIEKIVFKLKNRLSNDQSIDNFKNAIDFSREATSYFYFKNDERLINLLDYDMFNLFYNSTNDIKIRSMDLKADSNELLDMHVPKENEEHIYGHLTKRYVNKHPINISVFDNYTFYGSFEVFYINQKLSQRRFLFRKDGLVITNILNGITIIENIEIKDDKIYYNISFPLANGEHSYISVRIDNLEDEINRFISITNFTDIKLIFPELFHKEYFECYGTARKLQ